MIKNNAGKFPAEEAYDYGYHEISEILIDKEIALKKTNIVEEKYTDKENDDELIFKEEEDEKD